MQAIKGQGLSALKVSLVLALSVLSHPYAFATSASSTPDTLNSEPIDPAQLHLLEGVEYASVSQLNDKYTLQGLTSVSVVNYLLNRIERLDKNGPAINSIIELNPDALTIAAQRDQERSLGQVRGPLHGVPVLLKDNIQTADSMQTSAGSLALVGQPAADDAFIVQRLRDAGAIVLGKTNLSEWAGFRDPAIPSGWSARGGQTKNPHQLTADPCGSSTGSAAAAAAGFAPLTVGTETNGSIHCPSFMNGVVGLKPSLGLLSRSGIITVSKNQDTPGPITRTVRDAALLLNAMTGNDPTDSLQHARVPESVDYTARLSADALRGKRIGFPASYDQVSADTSQDPNFARALQVLRDAGAELVPVAEPSYETSAYMEHYQALLFMDLNREAPNWFSSRQGMPVHSLEELVTFNQSTPGNPAYGQDTITAFLNTPYNEDDYNTLWSDLHSRSQAQIDQLLTEHSLDALVDSADGFVPSIVPVAGYPGITVPSGADAQGTLKGLYFYGPRWSEALLLGLAYSYEQAAQARLTPAFSS